MKTVFQLKVKLREEGITEEVKLTWKTQPDGKIFHRVGPTEPPGDSVEEDCDTV